jgi:hypothetical protein
MSTNYELAKIWNEAVKDSFKKLSKHLLGERKENPETVRNVNEIRAHVLPNG